MSLRTNGISCAPHDNNYEARVKFLAQEALQKYLQFSKEMDSAVHFFK